MRVTHMHAPALALAMVTFGCSTGPMEGTAGLSGGADDATGVASTGAATDDTTGTTGDPDTTGDESTGAPDPDSTGTTGIDTGDESDESGSTGAEETGMVDPGETMVFDVIADTYIKAGSANKNAGQEMVLVVQKLGFKRVFVQSDANEVDDFVAGRNVIEATLELTIDSNGSNWGQSGRYLDAHVMTQAWTELGATFNCANDIDPGNSAMDCVPQDQWVMDAIDPDLFPWDTIVSDSALIQNGQLGNLELDVTDDVAAFLQAGDTYGWVVKLRDEDESGTIKFKAREGILGPRLRVTVE